MTTTWIYRPAWGEPASPLCQPLTHEYGMSPPSLMLSSWDVCLVTISPQDLIRSSESKRKTASWPQKHFLALFLTSNLSGNSHHCSHMDYVIAVYLVCIHTHSTNLPADWLLKTGRHYPKSQEQYKKVKQGNSFVWSFPSRGRDTNHIIQ